MRTIPEPDGPSSPFADLFAREVPEIASGVVRIRALARIPGVRTKISVMTNDPAVNPLRACVGVGGTRIQRIVAALDGERVDVSVWSDSPEASIRRAMAPVNIIRMEPDAERRRARVLVARHEYAAALGADGTVCDLASRLAGWQIELVVDPEAA